jgi:hypothetical protein
MDDGRTHLRLEVGQRGVDLKVEFRLQSKGLLPSGERPMPSRELGMSLRTPSVEIEVHPGLRLFAMIAC